MSVVCREFMHRVCRLCVRAAESAHSACSSADRRADAGIAMALPQQVAFKRQRPTPPDCAPPGASSALQEEADLGDVDAAQVMVAGLQEAFVDCLVIRQNNELPDFKQRLAAFQNSCDDDTLGIMEAMIGRWWKVSNAINGKPAFKQEKLQESC